MSVKSAKPRLFDYPEAPARNTLSGVTLTQIVARAFGAEERLLSRFLAPYGLSRPRATILRILADQPGRRLPLNEISKHMSVTTTNITKLVDGLEKSGLLTRVPSDTDRRVLFAQLTPEGDALQALFRPRVASFMAEAWGVLDADEQAQLAVLLTKIWAEMERLQESETAFESAPSRAPHG